MLGFELNSSTKVPPEINVHISYSSPLIIVKFCVNILKCVDSNWLHPIHWVKPLFLLLLASPNTLGEAFVFGTIIIIIWSNMFLQSYMLKLTQ